MEKRDLVKRVRLNDNYREVFLELTDNGNKVVQKFILPTICLHAYI